MRSGAVGMIAAPLPMRSCSAWRRSAQRERLRVMRRIRDEYQMREILFQRGPNETGEVEVAEEVAVDDKEGPVAEQVKRLCDSPRGFERLGLARVADGDAEAASIAERGFDHVAEMRVVDHDLANARAREGLDQPDDQGLAAHLEEPLGDRVG